MQEFLVEVTTSDPEGTDRAEAERRRATEAIEARTLAADGHLIRLWRPVGESRSFGLWRADSEEELHELLIEALPFAAWWAVKVTPLESHPNDPGPATHCR